MFFEDEFQVHPLLYIRSYNTRHVGSLRMIINFEVVGLDSLSACREAPYYAPVENLESSAESWEANAFVTSFQKG